MAPALVTEAAPSAATAEKATAPVAGTLDRTKLALFAPEMATPFFFHWKVGAGVPVAPTINVTLAPTVALCVNGCVVITGTAVTVTTGPIVSTAPALMAELTLFVATT